MLRLTDNSHLVDEIACIAQLFYKKKCIPDVKADVAALLRVIHDVRSYALPGPVEVDAYQMTLCVQHGTA